MKTEEIKPGDILYDEERKMLVKVARVDEEGVVKYSAYTDMRRIFNTPPPPYRVGTRTADAYVPATDEQRKYMERRLAVCEYVNLPKDNRMETLAYIIADLKAENVELEQRVHQLVDEYNNVARQLRGMEKRKDDPEKQMLGNMLKMRDHCDKLERENGELTRFAKAIHTFVKGKNLYMKKGTSCGYRQGHPAVCSIACLECDSCLGIIDGCGVICRQALSGLNIGPVWR
jgi:hypothetical protein